MFKKLVENFVCEHCGAHVAGTGYTNHCPKCLWGKHVDLTPGDRANPCGGMMEPIGIEGSTQKYRIIHRCAKCGAMTRFFAAKEDDPGALVRLAALRKD